MKTLTRKLKISRVWIEHKRDDSIRVIVREKLRMEAYNAGQWHMIGIIAKCEIASPAGIVQTLRSGGLWGVESDSGKEYLESVAKEQLQELWAELLAFGLGERVITHAFKSVKEAQ